VPNDPAAGWVLANSPRVIATVQFTYAAKTKLRMTAGPATSKAAAEPSNHLPGVELVVQASFPGNFVSVGHSGTYTRELIKNKDLSRVG
jgi:hypothetical protein